MDVVIQRTKKQKQTKKKKNMRRSNLFLIEMFILLIVFSCFIQLSRSRDETDHDAKWFHGETVGSLGVVRVVQSDASERLQMPKAKNDKADWFWISPLSSDEFLEQSAQPLLIRRGGQAPHIEFDIGELQEILKLNVNTDNGAIGMRTQALHGSPDYRIAKRVWNERDKAWWSAELHEGEKTKRFTFAGNINFLRNVFWKS